MAKLQLLVRLAPGTEPKWYLAENPAWIEPRADQAGDGGWLVALTPPLAADQAYFHWQEVDKRAKLAAGLWAILPQPSLFAWAVSKALRLRFPGHPRRLVPEGGQHRCLDPQLNCGGWWRKSGGFWLAVWFPIISLKRNCGPRDGGRRISAGVELGFKPKTVCRYARNGAAALGRAAVQPLPRAHSELRPCVKCGRIQCPACQECAAIGEIRGCGLLLVLWRRRAA